MGLVGGLFVPKAGLVAGPAGEVPCVDEDAVEEEGR